MSSDAESPKKLSLLQCRKLLGNDVVLADAELMRLRDELYQLAEIALEGFREREKRQAGTCTASGRNLVPKLSENRTTFSMVPEIDRESVEERAAILEFEGGCTSELAECQALLEWAGRGSKTINMSKVWPRKRSGMVQ